MLHEAANPRPDENGKTPMALWPAFAAQGKAPVVLAWAVALTELLGGGLLLVGLVTRLAALGIAGVMLGALWLAEIGPAIQKGTTYLGFIPRHDGGYAVKLSADGGYVTLLWQLGLLAMALAIALLGPGALSLDGALGGRKARPAPRPAAPPPSPGA
jgi:putative oxidoreductase